MRSAVAVLVVALLGCGGAETTTRGRSNVSLPREDRGVPSPRANRNGPPPPRFEEQALPAVVLWCSQPAGPACTAAQQELGLPPTPAEAVPVALLEGARDLDDDCTDPELAELQQRVAQACGVRSGRTADQAGTIADASLIADMYSGSGCVNVARPTDPTVKIHAVDAPEGVRFLVRVWEVGEDN